MDADPACPVETANAVALTTATAPARETGRQTTSTDVTASTRQLILGAVMRGLFLDEPWRHAYLRNRWIGL